MAGKGGARPNSGPKPKRDKYVTALTKIDRFVASHIDELLQAQFELAMGVLVEDVLRPDEEGKPRVYRTIPDAKAGQYLIDRLAGKPTQKQELSGNQDAPIIIKPYDYNSAIAAITPRSSQDSNSSGED